MANLSARLTLLEQRRAPAGQCPLVILHGDEAPTPHQQAEIERAERQHLPTLTIIIGSARYGK